MKVIVDASVCSLALRGNGTKQPMILTLPVFENHWPMAA